MSIFYTIFILKNVLGQGRNSVQETGGVCDRVGEFMQIRHLLASAWA